MKRKMNSTLLFFSLAAIFSQAVHSATTNESELGILLAKGNTNSESYSAQEILTYNWVEKNTLKFKGRYLQAKNSGIETVRYWLAGLRYDLAVSHRVSVFAGESLESDKYAGYNQKYNTDVGAKYALLKEPKFLWDAELGYRYTKENQLTGQQNNLNYVRAYTEATKLWSEGVSTKLWFEYLPNLTIGSDYQMNSELSVIAALNNVFSLKTGYLLRYDHLPNPGAHTKTDTLLTTALVAKF